MKKMLIATAGILFLVIVVWTNLKPPISLINVTSDPSDATVIIDDVERGTTPLETSVPSGRHSIILTKAGYTSYISSFQSDKGETLNISVTLEKLPIN